MRSFRSIPVAALPLLLAACSGVPDGGGEESAASAARLGNDGGRHEEGPALATRLDRASRTLELSLGPIQLPAEGGHVRTRALTAELPVSAWLTGFRVDVLDARGEVLPQSLLHHVNVMVPDRVELFRPIMQRLVAAGEETAPIELPWPFGIPASEGQRLVTVAMLHNPTDIDYGPVAVRMRIRYTEGRRRPVYPFFIDVSPPPAYASWDLPPGRSARSWEGQPAVDGRVLGIGGHLHRHGVELILEDVTAGKVLARLEPETDEDGLVVDVDRKTFIWRLGMPVRADHTYRITAVYENPTGDTIPDGAMGAIGGIVTPAEGEWPPPDPQDRVFRQDLEGLLVSAGEHAGHGAQGGQGH